MSTIDQEKVLKYEQFLNETLRQDLKNIIEERDKVYEEVAEFLQLKNVIQKIKESGLEDKELKTQVDLGCNFYVQARVPDSSKICVCVGLGFYVELTLDEATKVINRKVDYLNACTKKLTDDALKVKAHIKLVIEGLREIQLIDGKPAPPGYRDVLS